MLSAHIMVSQGVSLNERCEKSTQEGRDLSPPQTKLDSSVTNPECKGRYCKNP